MFDFYIEDLLVLTANGTRIFSRYEEKEKRRKRHKSASTKSHKDSDSSDTEASQSSRSPTPGESRQGPLLNTLLSNGRGGVVGDVEGGGWHVEAP